MGRAPTPKAAEEKFKAGEADNRGFWRWITVLPVPPPARREGWHDVCSGILTKGRAMTSITRDGSVEVRFFRPGARVVAVMGDFNEWGKDALTMCDDGGGWWVGRLRLRH